MGFIYCYNPVLAGPSIVLRPDFSPRRLSMGDSPKVGSPFTGGGHDRSPLLRVVESVSVAPLRLLGPSSNLEVPR